jgi:hypothetical protein
MTPREKALLASSPGLTVLVLGIAWWAIDPKGDARQHLIDLSIRFLDHARNGARL